MILEKEIDLYAYFGLKRVENARGYLNSYIIERCEEFSKKRLRPAMIVIPGGGYWMVSKREEEPIALAYTANGYQTFTLNYTTGDVCKEAHYPIMLIEAAMAVAYVRENAKKYNIREDKIAVVGFSAGGHLAGSISTMYDDENIVKALGERAKLCRPDASVLAYPVITFAEKTHGGTRDWCTNNNPELYDKLSVEKRVTNNTPPTFIWSTYEDNCVPIINSVLLAEALCRNEVPFDLHIYRKGYHGMALCTRETSHDGQGDAMNEVASEWIKQSVKFLDTCDFVVSVEE